MKHYFTYCRSLGLTLTLTACGDPSQFNELMTGDPIAVSPPEIASPSSEESKTPATAYESEIPAEEAIASAATEPLGETNSVPPSESESDSESEPQGSTPNQNLFQDCEDRPDQKIVAELYELPEQTQRLPDFTLLSALRTVCLAELNIKDRAFSEGFPGVEGLFEWFGLDMRFQVNAPKKGYYDFTLQSDDGAILWIDGKKVIDNDGLHAVTQKKARVYLSAGSHAFHVAYYQGPRWRIALELFWKVPGTSSKVYIPSSAISRPE